VQGAPGGEDRHLLSVIYDEEAAFHELVAPHPLGLALAHGDIPRTRGKGRTVRSSAHPSHPSLDRWPYLIASPGSGAVHSIGDTRHERLEQARGGPALPRALLVLAKQILGRVRQVRRERVGGMVDLMVGLTVAPHRGDYMSG
jgi:hypothetical protein